MRNQPKTKLQQAQDDLRAYNRGHGSPADKAALLARIRLLEQREGLR